MSFDDMAARREEEAATLEDNDIWVNIISKFVLLTDMPLESRADMMLQAVGDDKKLIIDTLKLCIEKRILTQEQVREFIQLFKKKY